MPTAAAWTYVFAALCLTGCATTGMGLGAAHNRSQLGLASYYAHRFDGRTTASGDEYDEGGMTAAHRTLPFGTRVRVTNLSNHRSVVVTINDRGPHLKGRIIDLSPRAARELGFLQRGTTRVRVQPLSK